MFTGPKTAPAATHHLHQRRLTTWRAGIWLAAILGLLVSLSLVYVHYQDKKAGIEVAAEAWAWTALAQGDVVLSGEQSDLVSSTGALAGTSGLRVAGVALQPVSVQTNRATATWILDPEGRNRTLIAVDLPVENGVGDQMIAKAHVDVTPLASSALLESVLAAGLVCALFLGGMIGALHLTGRFELLFARWQAVLDRQRQLVLFQREGLKDRERMNNLLQADLALALAGAEDAKQANDILAGRLTEELRTPLNGITGFAELMQRRTLGPLGNPGYDEYVLRIMDSARHMTQVMDDVADATNLESGEFELREGVVSLGDLADFCRGIAGPTARQQSVSLLMDVRGLPLLMGDERRLRQALLNLVTTCLNQAEEGGVVRISGRLRTGGGLALTIGDDTNRKAKKAPLQMGSSDAGSAGKAKETSETAANLALTRKLIEKHGGSLVVAQAHGLGAVYSLYFPASRLMRDESHGQAANHPLLDVNTPAMGSC